MQHGASRIEAERIRARYGRRAATAAPDLYSRLEPYADFAWREREKVLLQLLRRKLSPERFKSIDLIEIGCGNGINLTHLISLGAAPDRLVGNDLLESRLAAARERLPVAVRLRPGVADQMDLEPESFDIVYQSTVFSSILDDDMQRETAAAMWRWVRPGGAVLWYDFTVDNPGNADVHGVPLPRIRALFPEARPTFRRVTLAPPIGRRLARISSLLPPLVNWCVPVLRTHVWGWLEKPA